MKHQESKSQEESQRSAVIERLSEVRKEQAAALPPLAELKGDALDRLHHAHEKLKAAEAEYRRAADEYSSKATLLSSEMERLSLELKDLTPAVDGFLHRLNDIVGGGSRHQLSGDQMREIFRIRDEAAALWEAPAADLTQRLAALGAAIPLVVH